MKVIVISAHPDDLEIGCSGTLKKLQEEHNAEIISIITVPPSIEVNPARSQEIVLSETIASYTISKFELRMLGTPVHSNGRPNLTVDNNTITNLGKLFEDCDICILPNPQDYHQDHSNTYRISYPLALAHASEIWTMSSWPYAYYHSASTINLTHDITRYWDFKQSLLNCYASYLSSNDIAKIYNTNKWYGDPKDSIAEAFAVVYKHVN